MANSYTQVAARIPFPYEAALYAAGLAAWTKRFDEDVEIFGLAADDLDPQDDCMCDPRLAEDVKAILREYDSGDSGAVWTYDKEGLTITGDESPNLPVIAGIIQKTMRRFGITEPAVLEWAETCSHLVPGAFGGGCMIITGSRQRWINTRNWADEQIAELKLDHGFQSA